MANMSYCRFHNTNIDMNDCLDAVEEQDISSDEEVSSAKDMFVGTLTFLQEKGVIDEYDEEVLFQLLDNAQKED